VTRTAQVEVRSGGQGDPAEHEVDAEGGTGDDARLSDVDHALQLGTDG